MEKIILTVESEKEVAKYFILHRQFCVGVAFNWADLEVQQKQQRVNVAVIPIFHFHIAIHSIQRNN